LGWSGWPAASRMAYWRIAYKVNYVMNTTSSTGSGHTPPPTPAFGSPEWQKATFIVTVLENPWIAQRPTAKQATALQLDHVPEVFYGGSCGGGKSSWLLMEALKYVQVPGYCALLLRRTLTDLALPGALMDRAHQWLDGTAARWSEKGKTWYFPSGATLTFGFLERE